MHQNDVVIINVKPMSVECPLCGNDITEKNMKKTCLKNIEGHNVCSNCYNGLSETYLERCKIMREKNPKDWDGIWVMTSK